MRPGPSQSRQIESVVHERVGSPRGANDEREAVAEREPADSAGTDNQFIDRSSPRNLGRYLLRIAQGNVARDLMNEPWCCLKEQANNRTSRRNAAAPFTLGRSNQ
jgi:hypothetical protein